MSDQKMNLYQRIIKVYKEVKTVVKDATIEQGNNSYDVITHDTVTRALHMPLADAGIVAIPTMLTCNITEFDKEKTYQGQTQITKWYRADVLASVVFINADNPEERISSQFHCYAFDTSDKATGKAFSMAVKNIYLKTFMLESLDKEEARDFEGAEYKPKTQTYAKPSVNQTKLADPVKKPYNYAPGAKN